MYCIYSLSCSVVPSDSPQNFTSVPEQISVNFMWTAPEIPNGIVTEYNLTVTTFSTATRERSYNTTQYSIMATGNETYLRNVRGFVPYQDYNASITARTVVGYGPVASTEGRTEPDSKCLRELVCICLILLCFIIYSCYITLISCYCISACSV